MNSRSLSGFSLLLPGGGSGSRYGRNRNKLMEDLNGLPVFLHSIRTLAPLFDAVLMGVPAHLLPEFQRLAEEFLPDIPIRFLPGGAVRAETVHLLAEACTSPFLAVHDAARPLIRRTPVLDCGAECRKTGAAILCHPVVDTVKQAERNLIASTIPRAGLYAAETPQMFERTVFLNACRKMAAVGYEGCTDDASVLELSGSPVRTSIVLNHTPNPKLTHAEDLALCSLLLQEKLENE